MDYGHKGLMPSSIARATAGAALVLLIIAMGVTAARAASLGKLEIVSGVGEPLRGRIEVTGATRHELDTLGARLGSPVQYGEAGLTYAPALERVRFNLATQRGRHYINVISNEPYNEPVVDLVVELAWFGGATSYAYTALVDPAGSEKSPSVSTPSAVMPAPAVAALHHAAPRKPHPQSAKSAGSDDGALAIRLKEEKAEAVKHQLAAAQERIAELQLTVQEQEQLLASVAAEAIANDMRAAAAPGITRAAHEMPPARKATPAADTSDAWGGGVYMAGGGAAALLAVLLFMRRRGRRMVQIENEYPRLAPSLQAVG